MRADNFSNLLKGAVCFIKLGLLNYIIFFSQCVNNLNNWSKLVITFQKILVSILYFKCYKKRFNFQFSAATMNFEFNIFIEHYTIWS